MICQGATAQNRQLDDASGRPILLYDAPAQPYRRTAAQAARRDKMQAAVAAWHAASEAERAGADDEAARRKITRYQAWIGQYMRAPGVVAGSIWDGGASTWDGGTIGWDGGTPPGPGNGGIPWDGGESVWDGGASPWA
jgi:hypothetical protein